MFNKLSNNECEHRESTEGAARAQFEKYKVCSLQVYNVGFFFPKCKRAYVWDIYYARCFTIVCMHEQFHWIAFYTVDPFIALDELLFAFSSNSVYSDNNGLVLSFQQLPQVQQWFKWNGIMTMKICFENKSLLEGLASTSNLGNNNIFIYYSDAIHQMYKSCFTIHINHETKYCDCKF